MANLACMDFCQTVTINIYTSDEPGPCGKPDILDWSPNHAEISWAPPETDGGAPITHYIVEQKEKNMGQWVQGKVLSVKEVEAMGAKLKGKVDGLVDGSVGSLAA